MCLRSRDATGAGRDKQRNRVDVNRDVTLPWATTHAHGRSDTGGASALELEPAIFLRDMQLTSHCRIINYRSSQESVHCNNRTEEKIKLESKRQHKTSKFSFASAK